MECATAHCAQQQEEREVGGGGDWEEMRVSSFPILFFGLLNGIKNVRCESGLGSILWLILNEWCLFLLRLLFTHAMTCVPTLPSEEFSRKKKIILETDNKTLSTGDSIVFPTETCYLVAYGHVTL